LPALISIKIPQKIIPLFQTDKRYIVLRGGRGSSKSWGAVDYIITKCEEKKIRVLCAREMMNSIKDSVHKLISERIIMHGLESHFKITERDIKHINGSEIIFKGLLHNVTSIKSIEGVDICFVEEAQSVSRRSLEILKPTIRKENSKIIFVYNPTNEDDPVHVDFTLTEREDTLNIEVNYADNPFFPDVLREEMLYDKENDYEKYLHIWEGKPIQHAENQVFYGKWEIKDFETPEDAQFFHGSDFGFANDPTTGIRCFIQDDCLYIDRESYKLKLEITETGNYILNDIPTFKTWKSIGDCSRPETISHLNSHNGFNMVGSRKGAGSIEEGIQKIRQFKRVYIYPSCKETINEFRLYKWIKNKLTDENTPKPEDKNNHLIDALRYALEPYDRKTSKIIIPDKRMF